MKIFATVAALLMMTNVFAANATNGQKLYNRCVACHGKQGEGIEAQKAPRIGGQHDWYIYSSLVAFKNKERVNPTMYPFIKNLSDAEYQDLAAYISTLK
jgi:cytochrome c553